MSDLAVPSVATRRAWWVWGAVMAVYVLAVLHRSSLGVAGIMAADRFGLDATSLSMFTVLQLVMYAGMQVPVGILLDRYGSKVLILSGLVLMTLAQFTFAFTQSAVVAVLARGLLGAGDAMIFISLIRVVVLWFPPGRVPFVTQVTGWGGQCGAIIAATPFTLLLHAAGWTRSFAIVSAVGLLLMVLAVLVVADSPAGPNVAPEPVGWHETGRALARVWRSPGTRLGVWSHFVSQFCFTVFTLLWGYPFLVQGQGWSSVQASNLMTAMTGWAIVSGALIGAATIRWPWYRSLIVAGHVVVMAALWAVLLSFDGPAPGWLVVLTTLVSASGSPMSMIGFDVARTFTPIRAIGRANGIVNVGGFLASLLTMALMGLVLDRRQPLGMDHYDVDDFRAAFSVMYLFWAIGLVQVLRYRRRAAEALRARHPGGVEALKAGLPWTIATHAPVTAGEHGLGARASSETDD